MSRVLNVWWDDRLVGHLNRDDYGEITFTYESGWLNDAASPAISVSLPKQPEPFHSRQVRPFFGGLLPEAMARDVAAKVLGISNTNDFAMLERQGMEVAGAIQVLPSDLEPISHVGPWDAVPLNDHELIELLDDLPRRPLFAGKRGLRLSLAGAQTKAPVVLVGGRVALPCPGQPTTHILKPPIPSVPSTTENEAFAMRLASAVGLYVAKVDPRVVVANGERRTFLLVERYDRNEDAIHGIKRIHQEDFCQALGIPADSKYEQESSNSPTLRKCFDLLKGNSIVPGKDNSNFLNAVIFNAIIGNTDAHGKNFSLLYTQKGVRLAPLYDLLSTLAYPDLGFDPTFAMSLGGHDTLDEMTKAAWADFSRKMGIGTPTVLKQVEHLADAILSNADQVANTLSGIGLDDDALVAFSTFVKERAKRAHVLRAS